MLLKTNTILSIVAALLFIMIPPSLHAAPVTYTVSGVGSGGLGDMVFFDAGFTVTAFADTANVIETNGSTSDISKVINYSAEVSVIGFGTGVFTNQTLTVSNRTFERAGFGDSTQDLAIAFVNDSVFSDYDLRSSLGPVVGELSFNRGAFFPTTAGDFLIRDLSGVVAFTATIVPEPTTLSCVLILGCMTMDKRPQRSAT